MTTEAALLCVNYFVTRPQPLIRTTMAAVPCKRPHLAQSGIFSMGQLRTCRGTRSGRHWANSAHCQLSVTSSALASSVSGTVRPSALLEAIADKLRALDYLPIVFDFDRPTDRDLTETVKVLAGLSLFVVVDITNPRSVPLELQATVPDYMVPFVTLVERGQPVFGMFDDLPRKCDWALPLLEYSSADTLLAAFENKVISSALEKLGDVRRRKALPPQRRSAED